MMAPAQAQSSGLSPLILGLALILAAGYSALAAAFNKGYEATKFAPLPFPRLPIFLDLCLSTICTAVLVHDTVVGLRPGSQTNQPIAGDLCCCGPSSSCSATSFGSNLELRCRYTISTQLPLLLADMSQS